ncbi:hypothetical protein OUZ56_010424 [Daphnia magna]|uniref:Uncharacterized protein n=1 Tax=Daphnia magna TaxID=35525 RepID=A0ABR0AII5_9CRUS|nr:hypothetical protein OUZ56_010424 [Daphnia magna]
MEVNEWTGEWKQQASTRYRSVTTVTNGGKKKQDTEQRRRRRKEPQPKTAQGASEVSTARLARDSPPTTKEQQRAQKPTQKQHRGTAAKSKITKDETADSQIRVN